MTLASASDRSLTGCTSWRDTYRIQNSNPLAFATSQMRRLSTELASNPCTPGGAATTLPGSGIWRLPREHEPEPVVVGFAAPVLPPNAVRTCADAAAVTITHRPCYSANSSRYPLSDPSRERRMCALRAPAASAPARAQHYRFLRIGETLRPSRFHRRAVEFVVL